MRLHTERNTRQNTGQHKSAHIAPHASQHIPQHMEREAFSGGVHAAPLKFPARADRNGLRYREAVAEPSYCPECGAVYLDGHWQWIAAPGNALEDHCVACRRIREKAPAAFITVQGHFAREHHDEMLNLIRQFESHEKSLFPMQRIMSIDKRSDKLQIATTDTRLARGIGKALRRTFKGTLDFRFNKSGDMLRVHWQS